MLCQLMYAYGSPRLASAECSPYELLVQAHDFGVPVAYFSSQGMDVRVSHFLPFLRFVIVRAVGLVVYMHVIE